MINALFTKRFFTVYSFIGTGLSFWMSSSILAQTQNTAVIPVALPDVVTVELKEGGTISGVHLLEIDASKQQVKLEQSDREFMQDVAKIEKITLEGKTIIRGGEIVIRGQDDNKGQCGTQDTWNILLNHIKVTDSKAGKAEVNLSSMDRGKQREITQRSQTLTFVINEMQFNPTGKTVIKTTPCRAK